MDERARDVDQLSRDLDQARVPLDDLMHLLQWAHGDIGRDSRRSHFWRAVTPNHQPGVLDELLRAADSFVAALECRFGTIEEYRPSVGTHWGLVPWGGSGPLPSSQKGSPPYQRMVIK